jgi:flagellar hook-associated protein 3 FlgL
MVYNQLRRALQGNLSELAEKNTRLYTGKKIDKPSDDVIGMMNAMGYRVSISGNEQYQRNINEANTNLELSGTVMKSLADGLLKMKQLTSTGSDAQSQENRDRYAQEAAGLRDFFLGLSNTKAGNRYLFSGYQSDQKAFVYNSVTHAYDYQGDLGEIKVPVDKGADVSINIQGSRAFSFKVSSEMPAKLADGTPVSTSQTTDPSTGITTTTIEIGNAGDPAHDTFSFSNIMDLTNVMSYAWKYQDIDGTALHSNSGTNELMALHRIMALTVPLDSARSQALNMEAEAGIRRVQIRDQNTRLTATNLNLKNALTATEDADMTETITDIKKIEVALDALRASSASIMSKSLFDFLTAV